jgi:phage terminase small subunit
MSLPVFVYGANELTSQTSKIPQASQKPKKKKERALTMKERRFIKALPESPSISAAMRTAGYAKSTVDQQPTNVLGKPRVLSAIQKAMEKAGISDMSLAEKIREGMNATKVIVATENGQITDERYYKDYSVQHKYLDTAHKLRGDYPSEKLEVEHTGVVEVLHIPVKGQGWVE